MILNLLYVYAAWLFAAAMFFWLGSVLYRTTRNTFDPFHTEEATEVVGIPTSSTPPIPARKPRVPLSHTA